MKTRQTVLLCVGFFMAASCSLRSFGQTLEAIAILPADTFEHGPTSGQFITPANGRIPPFVNKQPVQGISAVLQGPGNSYLVMCDNGYGAKANSADFVLRVYKINADFKT